MIKKYKAFTKTGIMNIFAYKFNIFSWLLVSASSLICLFFLWQAVYNSSMDAVINGYTFKELISYTIIVHIFGFTMIGETMDTISDEIKKGQISMSLIKPISYRLRFTFGAFGALIAGMIKEVADIFCNKDFSLSDVIFTAVGGVFGGVLFML